MTKQMLEVAGQLVEQEISITTILVGPEHSNECVDQMSVGFRIFASIRTIDVDL